MHVSAALLDQAAAAFEGHVGRPLPPIQADPSERFAGLREHALAWAVRHLRARDTGRVLGLRGRCADRQRGAACHRLPAFRRDVVAPSAVSGDGGNGDERGFSLHGLALFAAAHSLAMAGNRIGFQQPNGIPEPGSRVSIWRSARSKSFRVLMDVFDRFEFPFGRPWDHAGLRAAVSEVVSAAQGRINLRNPGLLLLSPGTALAGYDEALIEAVKAVMPSLGRRNRGLMAVAPIVLRLQPMPDPHTIRIGYGLFPVQNRHYSGDRSGPMGG